jgi:hypothetical protein
MPWARIRLASRMTGRRPEVVIVDGGAHTQQFSRLVPPDDPPLAQKLQGHMSDFDREEYRHADGCHATRPDRYRQEQAVPTDVARLPVHLVAVSPATFPVYFSRQSDWNSEACAKIHHNFPKQSLDDIQSLACFSQARK